MELAEVEIAGSGPAQQALAQLPPYDRADALSLAERLRRQGHGTEFVSAVLTQARLRARVRARWGPIADRLVLTPDGAEQATRPIVAQHRAQRVRASGLTQVADLGCGLGLDALAMADHGMSVMAFDRDPATAAAAAMNAAVCGLGHLVEVRSADVLDLSISELSEMVDGAFADPARRSNGHRLSRPEEWSPPLSWVLALPFDALGVKVAPGLAHALVPPDHEFEVVSVDGDVVEAALYRGPLRPAPISYRATLLPRGDTLTDHDLPPASPPVGQLGRFLLEPDGAVIRAGLVGAVAEHVQGRLIDPRIAYVTTDCDIETKFATRYEVTDVVPFNLKRLRRLLRDRRVGRVTIKKRGFAAVPETVRKQLRLDRHQSGETTIVLTRIQQDPMAILVEPITRSR